MIMMSCERDDRIVKLVDESKMTWIRDEDEEMEEPQERANFEIEKK